MRVVIPIILAGGTGTRLWPLSRSSSPKQFLALVDNQTLLQSTLQRALTIPSLSTPIIVCNASYRFIAAEQARKLTSPAAILLEPQGRNTGPAVILSALYALKKFIDPVLLVLPCDQYITDLEHFKQIIDLSISTANEGKLVTFGIIPTKPHIGYGYIQAGAPLTTAQSYLVEHFVEKPNLATANNYINAGNYYWNSGIFLFKASTMISEAKKHAPELLNACEHVINTAENDMDFVRFQLEAILQCPNISIDHAIMEKTSEAIVFPFHSVWADLGDWGAMWEISTKDKNNNVLKGDIITSDTKNCYLHAESRLIATLGIQDLVIIETADAVLIAERHHGQEIKKLVEELMHQKRSEAHAGNSSK